MEIHHETLTFKRDFDAPPSQLFSAYVDTRARERWSTPSPTAEVRIDSSEVRTGGHETGWCGGKGDLRWKLRIKYHLVTRDRQITFTEELWDGEQILTVALITFDFKPFGGNKTALTLTDQVTSFVGADAVVGHRDGYAQALTNLQQHVSNPKSGHSH